MLTHCSSAIQWHTPWHIASFAQQGIRHYRDGGPCEDAHAIAAVGENLVLLVADGVSSADLGGEGAQIAVSVALRHLQYQAVDNRLLTRDDLIAAFEHAHVVLNKTADERKLNSDSFATTLVGAVVTPNDVHGAVLGDSSLVLLTHALENGAMVPKLSSFCSAPLPRGRKTTILSRPTWRECTSSASMPATLVDGLILATDGAENFFLDDPGHSGPITFDTAAVSYYPRMLVEFGPLAVIAALGHYLERSNAVNDDDRTLVFASRSPATLQPPYIGTAKRRQPDRT
jgi:hypothetical protein